MQFKALLQRSLVTVVLAASAAAYAEPATYVVEPTHTYVTFEARHFGTSTNRGRFDKKDGSVTIDPKAKTGKVEVTIDPGSINTGTDKFNEHLKSKDFFNVAEFPTAKFVGDKFTFDGDKVTEVAGTFTLHGVSQPMTLKASNYNCYQSPMLKKQVCGGDFETSIKRSAYGINFGLPFIPDDIRLLIQIEAVKQ
jgi:polyisoprenoid-binding protein YceI